MKRITAFITLIIFFTACTGGQEKTIKLSLILGDNSTWYKGALKWKELVEKRSKNTIKINIYPNAQLASNNQRTELEMVQSGVIDASLESTILLSLIDQRFSVFSLPFLFRNYQEAFNKDASRAGQALLNLLPEKNLIGLAYGVNGFRQLTNSKKEILQLSDLNNLKIRVPAISMYIEIFSHFKADPSSMNFGELFTALAQKTMDAQENPLHVIHSAKLYEVQKYILMWNYSYDPIILCINKKKWESYTPEEQKILKQAAQEAFQFQKQHVIENEKELQKKLKEKGMKISFINEKNLQEFRNASNPIHDKYKKIITPELYDLFIK